MKTLFSVVILILFAPGLLTGNAPDEGNRLKTMAGSPVFIQNKGQWPKEVFFLTKLNGLNAWITTSGVTYDHFTIIRQKNPDEFRTLPPHERELAERENISIKGHVVRMTLMNVNLEAPAAGLDCQQGYHNYFIGNDPSRWASNVPLYGRVEHNEIYDGISVEYYFDQGQLRYDYHLAPGADTGQIRINPEGTDGWRVNDAGELLIETSIGTICHGKLFAYQLIDGVKNEVACSFKQFADGSLGLQTGNYDSSKPLVIDPIVFSTYLGGNGYEDNPRMVLTLDESPVVAGQTMSSNFPVTVGAYQTEKDLDYDITISKFNSTVSSLVFSTFLGGNYTDTQPDIDIGQDGSFFIAGSTLSIDFPVSSDAFQTTNPGDISGFVTKLDAMGASLIYSTYLGGSLNDYLSAVVVDQTGNAYLTGFTVSTDFPITPGTINDYGSLLIVKLNPSANDLIYSTILPDGHGYDIAIDDTGNAYLTGESGWIPTTPGAFQSQNPGGENAFATVINPLASEILFSTYVGGYNTDYGNSICIAQNGDIIVGGYTYSIDFPTSPGSFQPEYAGNRDGFVIRLNATCTQMVWSSFLGGSDVDFVSSLAVDIFDNVAITGNTWSQAGFPITTNLYGGSVFVSQFSNDGSLLLYSALIGCLNESAGKDIEVKENGNIILTGYTGYLFLTTPDAFQQNFGGGYTDYFIMEIIPVNCQTICIATVLNHVSCNGGSDGQAQANPSGGIEPYSYLWSNGQTTRIATGLSAGDYTVEVTDSIGCTAEASVTITQPTPLLLSSLQTWPASCATSPDGSALAQASGGTPPYNYLWSNGETGNQATALLPGINSLTITDNHGCEKETSFVISYIHPFDNEEICAVTMNPETGYNKVVWEKTEGVRTIVFNVYRESSSSGIYEVIGSVPFDDPPIFEDLTANPAQQSYRYKLSVVDSCQEESGLSSFHKTIHLTMNVGINGEVNLLWSPYEGFSYPTHFIMRSVNNGPYQLIGQVPASNFSFTDLAPPAGLKKYMIEIDAPGSCGFRDLFRVRSNAVIVTETGVNGSFTSEGFRLYPNPGEGLIKVEVPAFYHGRKLVAEVFNPFGEMVFSGEHFSAVPGFTIDISEQPAGIYLVQLITSKGVIRLKFIKE